MTFNSRRASGRSAIVQRLLGISRLLKNSSDTLRRAQGERKTAMKLGRGSAHAEPVEAWGSVFQQPPKAGGKKEP